MRESVRSMRNRLSEIGDDLMVVYPEDLAALLNIAEAAQALADLDTAEDWTELHAALARLQDSP